ncbi:MAG: hypothetical protein M5U28_14525 [Sandaracinaceae bacterium]|nr:hypothetical protein [Sandaracinaceae bacterium]
MVVTPARAPAWTAGSERARVRLVERGLTTSTSAEPSGELASSS